MIYVIFIIWHFVLDKIIKGKWGATKIIKLLSHCTVYTLGFIPFFLYFNINLLWLPVLFISHFTIDLPDSNNERLPAKIHRRFKERFPKLSKPILGKKVWYCDPSYCTIWIIFDQLPHLAILLTIIRLG